MGGARSRVHIQASCPQPGPLQNDPPAEDNLKRMRRAGEGVKGVAATPGSSERAHEVANQDRLEFLASPLETTSVDELPGQKS